MGRRDRFDGHIAGIGSASGTRVVVGHWHSTPLGSFSDAMVETAGGHRVLLAPTEEVADYITSTYVFDEVRLEPLSCTAGGASWVVTSPSLSLDLTVGSRMPLGWLLRAVPRPLGASPLWARLVNPVARVVLPGVRTVGTALEGRREFYGATDLRRVTAMSGSFDGTPLGALADIDPPCRFGFSSTPRTPSVTTVVTTVVRSARPGTVVTRRSVGHDGHGHGTGRHTG
ncbi:hypothetical protein N798_02220 [Knoellia flava TL1]|uniref:Uncharacterized protein n=2 Tax=Knoellia flava TaxID=913969 RepID=A0A8H9FTT1_9MICO|nr:hypothetical protein [Knoellia flava]KGN35619.1 hypothetical protein N798_02220 [Knoellia flava TL1]GGB76718.1 hypothetical protein GCM10011314_15420 [Knoellia flava]